MILGLTKSCVKFVNRSAMHKVNVRRKEEVGQCVDLARKKAGLWRKTGWMPGTFFLKVKR